MDVYFFESIVFEDVVLFLDFGVINLKELWFVFLVELYGYFNENDFLVLGVMF